MNVSPLHPTVAAAVEICAMTVFLFNIFIKDLIWDDLKILMRMKCLCVLTLVCCKMQIKRECYFSITLFRACKRR